MYFQRTTYEYKGYTLIQNSFNRRRADAYGETQPCLIRSKVEKSVESYNRRSRKKQVYLFEPKSVTMSAWPIAGLLGCVL